MDNYENSRSQEYKSAIGWKNFLNIEPYELPSGIIDIEPAQEINHYLIYKLNGERITGIQNDTQLNNLPKGIYIVNGKKMKVN